MDARIEALRQQYEAGDISAVTFEQRVTALLRTLPPDVSWWQRFQHWRAGRKALAEERRFLPPERHLWLAERAAEEAHKATIDAWSAVYCALLARLSQGERHGSWERYLTWVLGIEWLEVSDNKNREMQVALARQCVQELVWRLERMDRLTPSTTPIHTPADVQARLLRAEN